MSLGVSAARHYCLVGPSWCSGGPLWVPEGATTQRCLAKGKVIIKFSTDYIRRNSPLNISILLHQQNDPTALNFPAPSS